MFFTLCRSPSPKGSISWGFLGVNGYPELREREGVQIVKLRAFLDLLGS